MMERIMCLDVDSIDEKALAEFVFKYDYEGYYELLDSLQYAGEIDIDINMSDSEIREIVESNILEWATFDESLAECICRIINNDAENNNADDDEVVTSFDNYVTFKNVSLVDDDEVFISFIDKYFNSQTVKFVSVWLENIFDEA